MKALLMILEGLAFLACGVGLTLFLVMVTGL